MLTIVTSQRSARKTISASSRHRRSGGRAVGTLGGQPHAERSTRPHPPRRLCLRATWLRHPRRRRSLSAVGADQRRYPRMDCGGHRHNDARHYDTCQPWPHRPVIGSRAADTSHLCRRCHSFLAPHRGGVRTRCCSAVACSWRGLDRGIWALAIGYGPLLLRPRFDAQH
jgi:hypothetical protein